MKTDLTDVIKGFILNLIQGRVTIESGFSVLIGASAFEFLKSRDVSLLFILMISIFGYLSTYGEKSYIIFKNKKFEGKVSELFQKVNYLIDGYNKAIEDKKEIKDEKKSNVSKPVLNHLRPDAHK